LTLVGDVTRKDVLLTKLRTPQLGGAYVYLEQGTVLEGRTPTTSSRRVFVAAGRHGTAKLTDQGTGTVRMVGAVCIRSEVIVDREILLSVECGGVEERRAAGHLVRGLGFAPRELWPVLDIPAGGRFSARPGV